MSVINSIPLIAAGDDGYQISRSVRLRSSATAYFNRTPASATNRTTWTWSGWVKRGAITSDMSLFQGYSDANNYTVIILESADRIQIQNRVAATATFNWTTTAVYRDPSAWYNIVVAFDTTQSTSTDRIKLYVNGVQVTVFTTQVTGAQNATGFINNNNGHNIGRSGASSQYFDGYMTEINFIDGQALTPSSFGETNPVTGVWQPKKYTGTYGTNGFYLNFSDNSAATATTIGKDYSGNGNNWTPNNISVTAGVTYDSMTDVPTLTSATAANYATLNPLDTATAMQASLASGNLELNANTAASGNGNSRATIAVDSGKWYFEATLSGYAGSSNLRAGWDFAIAGVGTGSSGITGAYKDVSSNQTVIIAIDLNNLLAWVGSNGTWDAGDPSAGTGGTSISLSGYLAVPFVRDNSGTAGNGGKWSANFGQRPFSYTPPTGFLALNTFNLPDPSIKNGASYMAATLYTGNATARTIDNSVNGVSFQPDWVWIKSRSATTNNQLVDAVRGTSLGLSSNLTSAEYGVGVNAFASNGFGLTTDGSLLGVNVNAATYVAWQWNAGGSTVTNTSGTISAQVRANPTAGFSVVTYTGNGTQPSTVGHGLGVAPSMVILKTRNSALYDWNSYHISLGNTQYIALNTTAAASSAVSLWNNTTPTSTVFTVNHVAVNTSSNTYVAYCFAAVAGYSAFGSYTGNGSTDGPFVYCGFRPRFVMIKRTDGAADWIILDTSRNLYNMEINYLIPNTSNAEATGASIQLDGVSNGIKIRGTWVGMNASGGTYIYMAFAENPFKNSLAR